MSKKELLTCLVCNTRRYVEKHPYRNASRYEVFLLESILHEQVAETYDEQIFPLVVDEIIREGFDISDFLLYNSNEEGTFTFVSMDEKRMFDIVHDLGGNIVVVYLDAHDNQQVCATIDEAIDNYCLPWN